MVIHTQGCPKIKKKEEKKRFMKFINDKVLTLTSIDCKMTESLNLTNKQQLQYVYVLNFLSINGGAQC